MKFEYNFDGLILKVLDESYAAQVLEFYSNNRLDFDRYENDKPDNFYTLEYTKSTLRAEYNGLLQGAFARFFLFSEDIPGKILGTISFSHISPSTRSCHIGYKIDMNYRNLGLATAMVSFMTKTIANDNNMHRIEAYIYPNNEASIHLVKKVGFVDEGIAHSFAMMRGQWHDHLRYVYIT